MEIPAEFLAAILNAFEANKRLADRAVEQVPDDKLHTALDPNTNSVAVIMKHVAGNLLSRWTDFLTTDGEKPDRDRDNEFVVTPADTRESLRTAWEGGWTALFGSLSSTCALFTGLMPRGRGRRAASPGRDARVLKRPRYDRGLQKPIAPTTNAVPR